MMRAVVFLLFFISISAQEVDPFNNRPANKKLEDLWNLITEDKTPLEFYKPLTVLGLFFSSLDPTFANTSDFFPEGRKKLIHTVGRVAKAKYVSTGNHPYTGVFRGCDNVLVRLSVAKATKTSDPSPKAAIHNFTPGMAIKFLRDNIPSANIQVMYSVAGQDSYNFFKNDFSNHIPEGEGFALQALGFKFSRKTPFVQTLGLKDLAEYTTLGGKEETVKYPFKIILKPTTLRNKFPDNYEIGYMDQLAAVPSDSLLYEVFAVESPRGEEVKIGELITESEMVSSRFGDEKLFFRHNLMEIDLEENKCWRPDVPKFGIFSSSYDKPEGCPFHNSNSKNDL